MTSNSLVGPKPDMLSKKRSHIVFIEYILPLSIMNLDTTIFFYLNSFAGHSMARDSMILFVAEYLPVLLIFFLVVFILSSQNPLKVKLTTLVLAFTSALISRFGAGSAIRYFWHRDRPFLTYHVHQLLLENSYSFPSGHSTFLFGFSTIVYMHHRRMGTFSYIVSALIVMARVIAGVHYPSDIFAGAVIGVIIGVLVNRYLNPLFFKSLNL